MEISMYKVKGICRISSGKLQVKQTDASLQDFRKYVKDEEDKIGDCQEQRDVGGNRGILIKVVYYGDVKLLQQERQHEPKDEHGDGCIILSSQDVLCFVF